MLSAKRPKLGPLRRLLGLTSNVVDRYLRTFQGIWQTTVHLLSDSTRRSQMLRKIRHEQPRRIFLSVDTHVTRFEHGLSSGS